MVCRSKKVGVVVSLVHTLTVLDTPLFGTFRVDGSVPNAVWSYFSGVSAMRRQDFHKRVMDLLVYLEQDEYCLVCVNFEIDDLVTEAQEFDRALVAVGERLTSV